MKRAGFRTSSVLLCCSWVLAAAVLSIVPLPASAQPAPPPSGSDGLKPQDQARLLADRGFELFKAGEYQQALAHFVSAEQVFHAPTLVLMIAQTQNKLGRLVEAEASYRRLVEERLPADAPDAFRNAQKRGQAELDKLAPRVPRLEVRLSHPEAATRVNIRIDGRPVAPDVPMPLNPGQHTVELLGDGPEAEQRTVRLAEGQVIHVEFEVGPAPERPAEAVRESQPPPVPDRPEPSSDSLVPALAAFGVGAAGLIMGVVAGAVALDKESELEQRCPDRVCFAEDEELADAAELNATLSTIGFVVAGVGVAAGVTLLLLRDDAEPAAEQTAVELELSPLGAVLSGTF